jgi:hypothetical protein
METEGLLNPDSEHGIFVLHCVYLPILQRSLQEFATAWNRHPVRTEHNWSPGKMWFNGMCDPLNSNQRGIRKVQEPLTETELENYVIDSDGPLPAEDTDMTVEVPETVCPLSHEQLSEFMWSLNSLLPAEDHGMSLYSNAKTLLCEILSHDA